jgi:hypothetical protein
MLFFFFISSQEEIESLQKEVTKWQEKINVCKAFREISEPFCLDCSSAVVKGTYLSDFGFIKKSKNL